MTEECICCGETPCTSYCDWDEADTKLALIDRDKRIAELKRELNLARTQADASITKYIRLLDVRGKQVKELEAEIDRYRWHSMDEAIAKYELFVQFCESLTGSLWEQNETTEKLSEQIHVLREELKEILEEET